MIKHIQRIFILFIAIALGIKAGFAQVRDVITPLKPNAVKLYGYLDNDIKNSLIHWNKGVVPYAGFVKTFSDGRKYFAEGEMWGKAVRSGAMLYRYTKDAELKTILQATVADLLKTQKANGSISASPVASQPDGPGGDMWERKYVLLGLQAYYEYVDKQAAVLKAMTDQADVLVAQIGPEPKTRIIDQGWSPNHIESSTLLEPVMYVYNKTGNKKYLDFARYIVDEGGAKGYNVIEQAVNNVMPHKMGGPYPKAYEMMSLFEGLAEYYRVTGDTRVKQAVLNLFNNIKKHEITIIGNGGGDLPYHPDVLGEAWDNTALEQTNPKMSRMMETCVGVTWIKLCSQVLRLTGDPSAADEIERYVYNGLIGAMKPEGDGFSYVNLLNGVKTNTHGWGGEVNGVKVTCCNLNGPMGLAYIPYVAVMATDNGAVVNFYNKAHANITTPKNNRLDLDISSSFPLSGNVTITVSPQRAEKFALKLRVPYWSKDTKLLVNGKNVNTAAGTYATINRVWKKGDRISLQLDMRCRIINAPKGSNRDGDNFRALVAGPIVLARDENIDPDFDKPVNIVSKNGYVAIERDTTNTGSSRLKFKVPTANGFITMVDYSSVNSWSGKNVCTWLPFVN